MFNRKAVMALAVMLASAGVATAETTQGPLTLDPSVITAADGAANRGLLMAGLDQLNMAKPLDDARINIYGWIEAGYYVNLRQQNGNVPIQPGPFTQQIGNHVMLNQLVLRFERTVDGKDWDVGGMIEGMFGTDANYTKSNGIQIQTPGDNPGEVPQVDLIQAYVDIGVPVGNGLKIRAGKFVTLLGYETIAPVTNPFYSHSYLFNSIPFTHTGVLAIYQFNEQFSFTGGITRGWDQATEDNNGAIDGLFQIGYAPSNALQTYLNVSTGPQNNDDESHWRTAINPVIAWKATERMTFGLDGLYVYDGAISEGNYGDVWGVAGYMGYQLSEMFTFNLRVEKAHTFFLGDNRNFYEITAGFTITPFPKDRILSNLKIRPELRYDFSEDSTYIVGDDIGDKVYKDQWTAGLDVIFTF